MQILKSFFSGIGKIISYINTYFKTFLLLLLILWLFSSNPTSSVSIPNLERIDLKGEILDTSAVLEKIINAKNDTSIKGVLFYIDSPGGAFAPSMELALAIKDLREKKPVVAYAAGTMASGSYLAGVGADKILSNPASFIGSIGVIAQGMDISELAQKLGVKEQTLKAGTFKEAGTFTRAWSEEERAYLQGLINNSYMLFVEFVAKERGLKVDEKEKWADARVFLANEAKNLGLIDSLSNYEQAKKELELLSKVANPVWKEADKIDKFLEKLNQQSVKFFNTLSNHLLQNSKMQVF